MTNEPRATWARKPILVLALGGNAITRAGDEPSVTAQLARVQESIRELVPVLDPGKWRVVITHGNGPQVGNVLLRSDLAARSGALPPLPVDIAVADTQAGMGYMLQQSLGNALWEAGLQQPVATVVTQVIVDEHDPAFGDPAKPVGTFYSQEEAEPLRRGGWVLKPDPQGRGWRRVVPSPEPTEIVELPVVTELMLEGVVVVACGGGGIPVAAGPTGALHGVEAVIDKDASSSLLATGLKADTLAILTEVDCVYVDYGAPGQRGLGSTNVPELRRLAELGHFPEGSMGPKVEAALRFVEHGGGRAVITDAAHLVAALAGRAGTQVTALDAATSPGGE